MHTHTRNQTLASTSKQHTHSVLLSNVIHNANTTLICAAVHVPITHIHTTYIVLRVACKESEMAAGSVQRCPIWIVRYFLVFNLLRIAQDNEGKYVFQAQLVPQSRVDRAIFAFLCYFTTKSALLGVLHAYHDHLEAHRHHIIAVQSTTSPYNMIDVLRVNRNIERIDGWLALFGSPFREVRGTGAFLFGLSTSAAIIFCVCTLACARKPGLDAEPVMLVIESSTRVARRLRANLAPIEQSSQEFARGHMRRLRYELPLTAAGASLKFIESVWAHERGHVRARFCNIRPKFADSRSHRRSVKQYTFMLAFSFFHGFIICVAAVGGALIANLYVRAQTRRTQATTPHASQTLTIWHAISAECAHISALECVCLAEMAIQSFVAPFYVSFGIATYLQLQLDVQTWLSRLGSRVRVLAQDLGRMEALESESMMRVERAFKLKAELIAEADALHVHFELLRSKIHAYMRLSAIYLAQIMSLAMCVCLVCFMVLRSRAHHDTAGSKSMPMYVFMVLAAITNSCMLFAVNSARKTDKLTRAVSQLMASSTRLHLQLSAPIESWRRQMLADLDTRLMFAPRLFGFPLTRDKIVKLNLYFGGIAMFLFGNRATP